MEKKEGGVTASFNRCSLMVIAFGAFGEASQEIDLMDFLFHLFVAKM